MKEINIEKESSAVSSDKLFEIDWAEVSQHFALVHAENEEEARERWKDIRRENTRDCGKEFSRDMCGGPHVKEVKE